MKHLIEKSKRLILVVSGGIGRNIFATAVVRNIKKQYPEKDLFVLAGYPDIFFNNPDIKRVYHFDKPVYMFEDYIFNNKDTVYLDVEPYRHPDYVNGDMHIVKAWCDLLGIECDSISGDLFFTDNETQMAKMYVEKFNKPLVLFQPIGGAGPNIDNKENQIISKSTMYRRSLPDEVIQEVVDGLVARDYSVGVIGTANQFMPKNSDRICIPPRAILSLIPNAYGLIGIDSFLMHGAAVYNKEMLVMWGGTSPEKLGYNYHVNLRNKVCSTPECHRPNSYMFDIQSNGRMWDCPYSDKCMKYKSEIILNSFDEMVKDIPKPEKKSIDNKSSCTKCK